jgi:uncharacterized protein DUF3551
MRVVFAALLFVASGSIIETAKAEFRWCSISNEGFMNCSFTTIEQCRTAVSGMGGFCIPEAPVGHRQPTLNSIEAARKADAKTPGR